MVCAAPRQGRGSQLGRGSGRHTQEEFSGFQIKDCPGRDFLPLSWEEAPFLGSIRRVTTVNLGHG